MKELYIFDFDKTLYKGNSTIDFYIFCIKKNIFLIRYLPIQLYGMILYKLKIKEKEYFKEKFFSFLKAINNKEKLINEFWKNNKSKFRKELLKDKVNTVVISASPEFLLKPICKELKIKTLIASLVNIDNGKFLSKNCYGEEKVKRLNQIFKKYEIKEFYSDSKSDEALAKISQKSYLIKKDKIIDWN